MQTLPFQKIHQVKTALKQAPLEDLVLIFSQSAGDSLLLVYNTSDLPNLPNPNLQTSRLQDLHLLDYIDFNGLVCGLSALDVILPGIPTHGVNFCSFQHIFTSFEERTHLHQSMFHLAQTLLNYLESLSYEEQARLWYRGVAKIFELSLPALLAEHSLENLMAILPSRDLHAYLEEEDFRLIYLHDLDQSVPIEEDQWLLAHEEINILHRGAFPENERFIPLRPLIHVLGGNDALAETLRSLARHFYTQAQKTNEEIFQNTAYYLAVEAWMQVEDVEDLVAVLPHEDFNQFVETGEALRIYRAPQISGFPQGGGTGPRYSLGDLVEHQIAVAEFTGPPVAFPILAPVFQDLTAKTVLDLGPVLWRAGRENELARIFWLLSRDLLYLPDPAWEMIRVHPTHRSEMALQSVLLLSLSDPWTWRQGRYPEALTQVYRHLSQCLGAQARNEPPSLGSFANALQAWYGCYTDKDLSLNLNKAVQSGHKWLENLLDIEGNKSKQEVMIQLVQAGKALLRTERRFEASTYLDKQPSKPFGVSRFKRKIVNAQEVIPLLSPPFEGRLRDYQSLHNRQQEIREKIIDSQPWREVVDDLIVDYQLLRRSAYAPAHELSVLDWRCDEDLLQLEQLKSTGEFGPIIRLNLRNPWVILDQREELHFDAENLGQENAYGFQLTLVQSNQFEHFSSAVKLSDTLAPGITQRFVWEIRAKQETLKLNLQYRYRDHKGEEVTREEEILVPVQLPPKLATRSLENLYQAGPPVFGEGRFFGRRKELVQIISRLAGGITQPILLRGPRRVGKTSVLRQVESMLGKPLRTLRPLGFSDEEIIQISNIHPISTSLQLLDPQTPQYVPRFFQTIYTDICKVLSITNVDSANLEKLFEMGPTWAFIQQVNKIFEQRPRARPLVLLDEWDELYRPEHKALDRNLRALIEREDRIKWVISSTWTLSAEAGRFGSPFYNQCFPIELHEMDWAPASDLVIQPAKRLGVLWHGEAVVTVLEQTGRRPYLTQLVCTKVVDHLNQISTNEVDPKILKIVIGEIIQETLTTAQYFGFLWDDEVEVEEGQEQVNWMGRLILWTLDRHYPTSLSRMEIRKEIVETFEKRGLKPPPQTFFDNEFKAQMTLLHQIFDAITLQGTLYQFSVPLVRRWLHQVISRIDDPIAQMHAGLMWNWQRSKEQ